MTLERARGHSKGRALGLALDPVLESVERYPSTSADRYRRDLPRLDQLVELGPANPGEFHCLCDGQEQWLLVSLAQHDGRLHFLFPFTSAREHLELALVR